MSLFSPVSWAGDEKNTQHFYEQLSAKWDGGILSLNINVLSLHNISGAVDIVVKKKCMTLTFFFYNFKVVEETYYKS